MQFSDLEKDSDGIIKVEFMNEDALVCKVGICFDDEIANDCKIHKARHFVGFCTNGHVWKDGQK